MVHGFLKKRNIFPLIRLLVASMVLSSCATGSIGGPGFDTSRVSARANFSTFEAVYIAPIEIAPELSKRTQIKRRGPRTSSQQQRPLLQRDIDRKAAELAGRLSREIKKRNTLANAPGENVLTLRTILRDIEANEPTQADYGVSPGLSFRSDYTGGASASFMLVGQGQTLAEFSDTWRGDIEDIRGGAIWGDTDYAFSKWARGLAAVIGG